jgi:hypothetical protein
VHTAGDSNSVTIAVDFPMTGRGEASFAQFAQLLGPGTGLWETSPAILTGPGPVNGPGYVQTWLDELRASGVHVAAIFSYCAGASYVAALDRGIRTWQEQPPQLILFDPELPVALTLHWQFRRVLERFSAFLSAAELEQVSAAAEAAYQQHPDDIAALHALIDPIYRETGGTCVQRAGLEPRHGAELLAAFDTFARYLVAGAQLQTTAPEPGAGMARAVAISSNTPTNGLNLVPEEQRATLVGREIRFDLAHPRLLADPEVARTVTGLLADAGVARTATGLLA